MGLKRGWAPKQETVRKEQDGGFLSSFLRRMFSPVVLPTPKQREDSYRAFRRRTRKMRRLQGGNLTLGANSGVRRGQPQAMAIPLESAKRSRDVRAARARGDGPGMTNPHGYGDEAA